MACSEKKMHITQPADFDVDGPYSMDGSGKPASVRSDGVVQVEPIAFSYPEGFQQVELQPHEPKGGVAFAYRGETCRIDSFANGLIAQESMPIVHQMVAIDCIRCCLGENQGIIEVETGETPQGNSYLYSIVKTFLQKPVRTQYGLCLQIGKPVQADSPVANIQAVGEETGVSGARHTLAYSLELDAGNVGTDEDPYAGWCADPYDSSVDEGFLMSLAEKQAYDKLFPDHPLSQLRALKDAIIAQC